MQRWMDAYQGGLETQDAQKEVKMFSSKTYKLHQHIPEAVASIFDLIHAEKLPAF